MTTPPQTIIMSAGLFATGARPLADAVASAFPALDVGQPLGTGDAKLAEHSQHGHEDEEEDNDLRNHVRARSARTRRVLLWRLARLR